VTEFAVLRSSRAENAVEQGDAFVFLRQEFGKRFTDQFLCRFIHEPAKSGIGIAHDVGRSLDLGDWQRRVLGDRQAEARQVKGWIGGGGLT